METILINNIQDKISKAGKKYFVVTTDRGEMTAFDGKVIDELRKNIGKRVEVETATSGDFTNIREFKGIAQDLAQSQSQSLGNSGREKGMFVSYAKDIFLELLKRCPPEIESAKLMEESIDLIQQAIDNIK